MKKTPLFLIAVCLISLKPVTIKAQQKDTSGNMMRLAFGIRANTFVQTDFVQVNLPPARLAVNFDPIQYLRLEIQYGYGKTSNQQVVSNVIYTLDNKTSVYTGGLFGMYKMDKTNFYLGVRYGKGKYTVGNLNYDSFGTLRVETNNGKLSVFYGVLGGEYFFGKRFSVAGEFAFASIKDVYDPAAAGQLSTTSVNRLTEGSLMLRFYPF